MIISVTPRDFTCVRCSECKVLHGVWTGLEKDDPLPILGAGAHARDQRDGCCVGVADGLLGGGRIRLRY